MGKGLLEKAGRIQLPATKPAAPTPSPGTPAIAPAFASPDAPAPRPESSVGSGRAVGGGVVGAGASAAPNAKPRTAPGTLMGFMANQSEAIRENERLREQMSQFDGARPARLLDPQLIRASAWANRHPSAFERDEFQALRTEIAQSGGNVQPIKVRPIPTGADAGEQGVGRSHPWGANADDAPGTLTADGAGQGGGTVPPPDATRPSAAYEIVFGHRRHRACLELGLPVLAFIEETSEQDLFVQMERENRNRSDLSVWEQGMTYAKALDRGLYASNRQLATAIGRDLSDVGKALAVARLPAAVIEAFASPQDLQFRWAKPLSDAQQKDPDLLLSRARALREAKLSAKEIFSALVAAPASTPVLPSTTAVARDGVSLATISRSASGHVSVKIHATLDAAGLDKLARALEKAL